VSGKRFTKTRFNLAKNAYPGKPMTKVKKTIPVKAMDNPQEFAYIPKKCIELPIELRFRQDLSWAEKCFISEIASMCDSSNCCVYNIRALSKLFRVSTATINLWINNLAKRNAIEINKKRGPDGWYQYIKLLS